MPIPDRHFALLEYRVSADLDIGIFAQVNAFQRIFTCPKFAAQNSILSAAQKP